VSLLRRRVQRNLLLRRRNRLRISWLLQERRRRQRSPLQLLVARQIFCPRSNRRQSQRRRLQPVQPRSHLQILWLRFAVVREQRSLQLRPQRSLLLKRRSLLWQLLECRLLT
jgi:hypothetical protein